MAYYTKTFEALHALTPAGEENYRAMLEKKADEILFKHEHPFKWLMMKLSDAFHSN